MNKAHFGRLLAVRLIAVAMVGATRIAFAADKMSSPLVTGEFRWKCSAPLVEPVTRPEDPCRSIKDPSLVRYDGRWHVFCTIRSQKRTHQIEYLSFADWEQANASTRHVLAVTNGYFC